MILSIARAVITFETRQKDLGLKAGMFCNRAVGAAMNELLHI